MQVTSKRVGIALGSNLGERDNLIEQGFAYIETLSGEPPFLRSSIYETAPVDCPPDSPKFLNAVIEVGWRGTARELLRKLQVYELARGRDRVRPINAPRPLDLDILYCGEEVWSEGDLVVPHPRLAQRRFVLEPLAEIRPDLVLPGQAVTVQQLLNQLGRS